MSENKFTELLDQLANGEVQEIIVEQPEFLLFREVWIAREDRPCFVGEAGLNGKIIYRYVSENK